MNPNKTEIIELSKEIRIMAHVMSDVADRMAYYAGFDGQMLQHSRELKGAAAMALSWSEGIDEKIDGLKRRKK